MKYVGVDLHKNQFTVCFREENGKEEVEKYSTEKRDIEEFKKRLDKKTKVALETTGNSRYFYDQVVGKAKEVKIIDTNKFKVISSSVKKTDKEDARVIAEYLSKDMIPEVRVGSKEQREINSLIQTRDHLVKTRSRLKNKIHGILMENGIKSEREMFSSEKALKEVLKMEISETNRFELEIIVGQIKSLNEGIKKIEEKIKEKGEGLKGQKNLQSITGIGKLSSTIILNKIGDIKDFAESKKLVSYMGLAPSVRDSDKTIRHGHITKRGDKILRTTIVQVTLIAIKYNNYLKSFYLRLKKVKGSGKAIIATARKMVDIIYRTLRYNLVFEDFNNGVLES